MPQNVLRTIVIYVATLAIFASGQVRANDYREQGKSFKIADAGMAVTPPRDWNQLSIKPGKYAVTWTLDGEQLNDVTFYGGVEVDKPLVRERSKKHDPLPKFSGTTLLVEVPELLQRTYQAYKKISEFTVTSATPGEFLGEAGVHFAYEYLDDDNLPRKGEARATIIEKRLYMITFDAPRLHYFDRTVNDFRALAEATFLQ